MTNKQKQCFWLPVRILEAGSHAASAPRVPSFVCRCLSGQYSLPWTRRLLSEIRSDSTFVERANERWESLMGSLSLVNPNAALFKREANQRGLYRLFRWFLKSLVHCGQDWLDERLKAMFEFSRHVSGLPIPESSKPSIPSGTPGFDESQQFVGYSFFRNTSWKILNKIPTELGWEVEAHWTFSLGKRAMGFPTGSKRVKSVLKFWKRTRSSHDPPKEVRDKARTFAYEYANRFDSRRIRANMNIHISYTKSSCWEVSRGKGGRNRFNQIRLNEFDDCWWIIPRGKTIFGPSGRVLIDPFDDEWIIHLKEYDDEFVIRGLSIRFVLGDQRTLIELSFAECSSDDSIPLELDTRPLCSFESESFVFHLFEVSPTYSVPEIYEQETMMRLDAVDDDGAKARIIGISQGALINIAHLVRTLITSVIKCDREVPTMGWVGKKPDRTLSTSGLFDSADLTAATDCSSILEAIQLAHGVIDSLEERDIIPYWLKDNIRTLLDLCLRSQEVHSPSWWDGPDIFPFSTIRSVPMGQPHSWVLLCLGQLFHRKNSRDLVKDSLAAPRQWRLTVCGDDSASSGNSIESSLMFRISVRKSGYELSSGTDIISQHVVQYTEQQWVKMVSDEKTKLVQIAVPFVKSLVSKNLSSRAPQKRGKREKLSHTSRGSAMTSATLSINLPLSEEGWVEKVRKSARLYSLYSNYRISERAKALDLPLYVPVEFGGLGFSHPTDKGLRHTRPFYLKGISSLISENRNIDYILSFRTLGSYWFISREDEVEKETKILWESWVSSVFESNRKVRGEHDLELSKDMSLWDRPCWVDVIEIGSQFNLELEVGDWKTYDLIKSLLKEKTGINWFPIKETLDHVEAGFRNEVLFRKRQDTEVSVPSLSLVSKRVHRFYQNRLNSYPPRDWRSLKDKNVSELLDILHWRQNLVLVSEGLPRLENFSSRW